MRETLSIDPSSHLPYPRVTSVPHCTWIVFPSFDKERPISLGVDAFQKEKERGYCNQRISIHQ